MNDETKISAAELRAGRDAGRDPRPIPAALELRRGYSRGVLLRMLIVAAAVIAAVAWQADIIRDIYIRHQIAGLGPLINGSILALFALGVVNLIWTFLRYSREEGALRRFVGNVERGGGALPESPEALETPLESVRGNTIIARRYRLMRALYERRSAINHSALAATLTADESTRSSMARFINNILILAGVFGTIVSLSVALLGASNLLTGGDGGGMSTVLSGMSTALSTTITAIVCYLYFGYFFIKLQDAQTNVINSVEQITAAWLVPRFQLQSDTAMHDLVELARKLANLVDNLTEAQAQFRALAAGSDPAQTQRLLQTLDEQGGRMSGDISDIKRLLKSGFRLHDDA